MKPIPEGYRTSHQIIVTERMTVDFEEPVAGLGRVHQVYATYWLARHFELVSRKLTLPYLEAGDEGIGFELSVRHVSPALPGMAVDLEARFLRLEGKRLLAECRAWNELGDLVGEGSTTQVVMARGELERRFRRLRDRWRERPASADDGGLNAPD
jgi:fluoroacetyl-CoA thioesterase